MVSSGMIKSYRDKLTQRFAEGERVREFEGFAKQAEKRLEILAAAKNIQDLRALRSNHAEALKGDRRGQFSIRINAQWRICFIWPDGDDGPSHVEITDYH
jgi:proteic killer suppression protein